MTIPPTFPATSRLDVQTHGTRAERTLRANVERLFPHLGRPPRETTARVTITERTSYGGGKCFVC